MRGRRLRADVADLVDLSRIEIPPFRDRVRTSIERTPELRSLARQLDDLDLPEGMSGRQALEHMSDRVLRRLLDDYAEHTADVVAEINSRLSLLMEDSNAIQSGALGRGPEARAKDIQAIEEQLRLIRTFSQHVDDVLGEGGTPFAALLRQEIEAGIRPRRGRRLAPEAPPELPPGRVPAVPGPAGGVESEAFERALSHILVAGTPQWRGRRAHQLLRLADGNVEAVVRRILARSGEVDPAPAALAVLRAAGLYHPRRVRRYNQQFMSKALRTILDDPEHPLGFLVDRDARRWRSRVHGEYDVPAVQAGHKISFHSGEPERLCIEDADFNQWSNWFGENRGTIFDKPIVLIGGVPVEKTTASRWESHTRGLMEEGGDPSKYLLPPGTVEAAPSHPGWAAE